jgi:hypothetical protein
MVGMAAGYRPSGAGDGKAGRVRAALPAPAAAGPAATAAAAEATATATTATTPVAAAAPGAGSFGLLDLDGAAVEVRAVEAADGLLGFLRRRHLDETETPRATGVSVGTLADSTLPTAAKASRRRSLEVENDRPPTKSFTAMEGLLLTAQGQDQSEYTLVGDFRELNLTRGAIWSYR